MKFLVFTTDLPPLPGLPTSGTALRTFGLAQGLRAHGHEVEISVPRTAVEGMAARSERLAPGPEAREQLARLTENAFDYRNQGSLVQSAKPDVVICGHWPAAGFDRRLPQPLVIDLAGPHLLERHYQGEPNHEGAVLAKLGSVAKADLFIVSGPTQRLYFYSFLLRAGVTEPDKRTVTIPMPLRPDVPESVAGTADGYPKAVFAGVFLPWQDPSEALECAAEEFAARGHGSLTLIGGTHPHYGIPGGLYAELFARLGRERFVRTRPMLPFDELLSELRQADVAIDLMRWNLERELAMTIRSTTYLWSGLPVIYNDYADLGRLIREYDAGWTIPPSSPAALRAVLADVFARPEEVQRKGRNATRLTRDVFAWDRAVQPLLAALGASAALPWREEVDLDRSRVHSSYLAVARSRQVEQQFLSRIDGLCRVECFVTTCRRPKVRDVTLSVHRLAGDGGFSGSAAQLVGRRTVPAAQVREGEWLSVEFGPVPDSAGRRFVFTIESEDAGDDDSVGAWIAKSRPFPLEALHHGGRPVGRGSLCLRTISSRPAL